MFKFEKAKENISFAGRQERKVAADTDNQKSNDKKHELKLIDNRNKLSIQGKLLPINFSNAPLQCDSTDLSMNNSSHPVALSQEGNELLFGDNKQAFLTKLKADLVNTGNNIFSGSPLDASICPWINKWFELYKNKPSNEIEESILDYLGLAKTPLKASNIIEMVLRKATFGFNSQLKKGVPSHLPKEVSSEKGGPFEQRWTKKVLLDSKQVTQGKFIDNSVIQMGGCCGKSNAAQENELPFGGLDPQSDAIRPTNPHFIEGQLAAQRYIDSISKAELAVLKRHSVEETALVPEVQEHLAQAMTKFGEKQPYPAAYSDLGKVSTLGVHGNCMDVSPVFGYLLNRIHESSVVQVHRPGGLEGPHTMLKTTDRPLKYIDATWRQGGDSDYDDDDDTDPRKQLDMVRVSDEEPTLIKVNEAVKAALKQLNKSQ